MAPSSSVTKHIVSPSPASAVQAPARRTLGLQPPPPTPATSRPRAVGLRGPLGHSGAAGNLHSAYVRAAIPHLSEGRKVPAAPPASSIMEPSLPGRRLLSELSPGSSQPEDKPAGRLPPGHPEVSRSASFALHCLPSALLWKRLFPHSPLRYNLDASTRSSELAPVPVVIPPRDFPGAHCLPHSGGARANPSQT